MKKVSRKIIGARNLSKQTAAGEDPIHSPESEHSNIDAFYQRMLDRDIYLYVSEVSVAMIGVCLTGVSILNVDEDVNSLNIYVHYLLAIDSLVFLTAYLLSYWVVRVMTRGARNVRRVGNIANAIFLIGMVFMAIICICVVCQGNYTSKLDNSIAKLTNSF
jgi:uncharacterized membrane protein